MGHYISTRTAIAENVVRLSAVTSPSFPSPYDPIKSINIVNMKACKVLLPFTLLGTALGVDMAKYQAGSGVDASFEPFLESYVKPFRSWVSIHVKY